MDQPVVEFVEFVGLVGVVGVVGVAHPAVEPFVLLGLRHLQPVPVERTGNLACPCPDWGS